MQFIEKGKIMLKEILEFLYSKYKILSLAIMLVVLVFGICLFIQNSGSAITGGNGSFGYSDFNSNVVSKDSEKIIDNSSFKGIFVYGPYANIKAGKYKGTINYNSTVSVKYELTSGFGANLISTGTLLPNRSSEEFNFNVPTDVNDKSLELRVYYDGSGKLEFDSFEYEGAGVSSNYIIPIIALLLCLGCSIFRLNSKRGYLTQLYLLLFYVFGISYLSKNIVLAIFVGAIQLCFVILISLENGIFENISLLKGKEYFAMLVSTFLIVSAYCMKTLKLGNDIKFVGNIDKDLYWFLFVALFSLIFAVGVIFSKKIIYIVTFISSVAFGILMVKAYNSIYVAMGAILILGYFNYLLLKDDNLGFESLNNRIKDYKAISPIVTGVTVVACVSMILDGVYRYKIYGASTFDFGIFAQMYEYMAKTGLPLTTCERGQLLSHFYIHFSPIYYLFLPVYMIFRTPITLIVIQSIMVFGAVIPLLLLCKKYGIKPLIALVICFIYIYSPAIVQPLLYDFHENAFIPFFVLWFVYFLESKNFKLSVLFLFLCLMIKEDTSLYMIAICIFYAFRKGYLKNSLIMLCITLVYFSLAMTFISVHGMGLMEGHYGLYYLGGEKGMLPIIRNIWYAPEFFVKNVFADDNFKYVIYTMGSLLFVPLMNKDFKRLILIIPFIAFGLMTDYAYQHDIGFQYTYGLMTCMFLLFILNVRDFHSEKQSFIVITSLCAILVLSAQNGANKINSYKSYYDTNKSVYQEMDSILEDNIPSDSSVSADTYLVPHLYKAKELYDLGTKVDTDYYVLQKASNDPNSTDFMKNYSKKGYKVVDENNKIIIYKK